MLLPKVLCMTPAERPDLTLVRAIGRTSALGVIDLTGNDTDASATLNGLVQSKTAPFGVRLGATTAPIALPAAARCVVLDAPRSVERAWLGDRAVLTQVCSLEEALMAMSLGTDALVVKGSEAGGRIGSETSFVLFQRILGRVRLPLWVQGGIGPHTGAAVVAAGAHGVVLDSQLLLTRECSAPAATRRAVRAMDGSETRVLAGLRTLRRIEIGSPGTSASAGEEAPSTELRIGQDAAFAHDLATAHVSARNVIAAFERSFVGCARQAKRLRPIAPGSGIAASHGMLYPIMQGPMTRVSDRAEFAAAVSDAGALPMLALALMRGSEVRTLMEDTARLLGGRPWGVGLLGFIPEEIRREQLEVVRALRPPVALVAGARKALVEELSDAGVATYVHVPSPVLLDQFVRDGMTRFVLEGSECGGHVGPRSSFTLWEQAVTRLCQEHDLEGHHVVFAGGIHDAISAAMVAVLAAPLCARGARVGLLVGTAYLLTREAVETGAIAPVYQEQVIEAERTVLLESGPGHAIRALENGFCRQFEAERLRLEAARAPQQLISATLEELTLGRLRVATKGMRREAGELVALDADEQRRAGLFMSGQVAALRDRRTTIAELHRELSEAASTRLDGLAVESRAEVSAPEPLAIVGIACLLPGSGCVGEYWEHILRGDNCVSEVPESRWRHELYYRPTGKGDGTNSKWGGFIPVQRFEPRDFGIPPRSVGQIDPAQLLTLLTVRAALADAGVALDAIDTTRVGVILGGEASIDLSAQYILRAFMPSIFDALPAEVDAALAKFSEDSFPGVLGNVIAGRVSNRLDLGGPNYTVNAACASSLAAIDCACRELRSGGCDIVVAGGVDLHNSIYDYLMFANVQALSPSGQCKAFDAAADGIALSEGVGVVVLKRFEDAVAAGDRVYAKILAIGSSSDGRSQSLTAPRLEGQLRAVRNAYDVAGVSPCETELIEAHGTGTVLGDRTELQALTGLLHEAGAEPRSCVLGSVKSQIGHTKCAAGVAGLIKAALAIHHGILPPTTNLRQPNACYNPDTSPFVFQSEPRPWLSETRRAGVSAFGFGGTNFHALLEGTGSVTPLQTGGRWPSELLLLRGRTRIEALESARNLVALVVQQASGSTLAAIAAAVAERSPREEPVQVAMVIATREELERVLARLAGGDPTLPGVYCRREDITDGRTAFLFPGQGSQRPGMLRDIFCYFEEARAWLGRVAEAGDALFPPLFEPSGRAAGHALRDTLLAQPTLGAAALAMADVLAACGVVPDAAAGHSYGELSALCHAGVIPRDALIGLSRARARAMSDALAGASGCMAIVSAAVERVQGWIDDLPDVWAVNINSPRQVIVAGTEQGVACAVQRVAERGVNTRRLSVPYAFHTPRLAAAAARFAGDLSQVTFGSFRHPVWSNVTGRVYPRDAEAARSLLADQVARPVLFEAQIRDMYASGVRTFIEVGPGEVLTGLARDTLGAAPHLAVATDGTGRHGVSSLLHALAAIASAGVALDERWLYRGRGPRSLGALQGAASDAAATEWLVDGRTAWPAAQAAPAPFSRQGAGSMGVLAVPSTGTREGAVRDFLERMSIAVEAQRDVMLAYLRTAATPVSPSRDLAGREQASGEEAAQPDEPYGAPMAPERLLLELFSERTGYPVEMLNANIDLEADLGVDSIKRMEVLQAFVTRAGLERRGEESEIVERLMQQRTIGAILQTLDLPAAATTDRSQPASSSVQPSSMTRSRGASFPTDAPLVSTAELTRLAFQCEERTAGATRTPIESHSIADGSPEVAGSLMRELARRGCHGVQARGEESIGGAGSTLICLGDLDTTDQDPARTTFRRCLAALTRGVCKILVVTALGGRCGVGSGSNGRPGGSAGLIKSLAKEYPEVRFQILDVDATEGADAVALHIADELCCADDTLEVGRRRESRIVVRAEPRARAALAVEHLSPESVVLVLGGARGIGTVVAKALYERWGCRLELAGRSDLRQSPECQGMDLEDPVEARRAILADAGASLSPGDVESRLRRWRAIQETERGLASLRRAGAGARYRTLDVRNGAEVASVVGAIYAEYGRLDGIIHAAGVIEDGLARSKTSESFDRVYDTKVRGARNLMAAARADTRFVAFFSSVAAAFGNRGQADYAAANDVLDKLASAATGANTRVLSIGWGPWSGVGMVGKALERDLRERGVGLIAPEAGARAFIEELVFGDLPHVVLTAGNEASGG